MYHNIHQPFANLVHTLPKAGGICSITAVKWEDVLTWPEMDPLTGILITGLQLKIGGQFYTIEATENDRTLKEEMKLSDAGPYMDIQVTSKLAGNNAGNTLSLDAAKFHQWVLLVQDRNGDRRMIGNEDSGARLSFDYTTSDIDGSRMRNLKWLWQHLNSAPTYSAAAYNITIGGATFSVGTLTLLTIFQVGKAGAPMADGDTLFTHAGLTNKKALILADGIALPVDDGSGAINWAGFIGRHIQKTLASATATFVGGVNQDEIITVYAFT